jgi:hypothetical protein
MHAHSLHDQSRSRIRPWSGSSGAASEHKTYQKSAAAGSNKYQGRTDLDAALALPGAALSPTHALVLAPPQVKVAVVTKTVSVRHSPAAASAAMLVAALNEARLEASLLPPRQLQASARSWVPCASTLLAAALLALSCLHYLAKPIGHPPESSLMCSSLPCC